MNVTWKMNQSYPLTDLMTTFGKSYQSVLSNSIPKIAFNLLAWLRQWLDQIEIRNPEVARLISKLIPSQCPFERDIVLFGRKVGHIPPLCKLNPFYEQFVGLRFRALCFLADYGEDIQSYCS